MIDGLSGSRPPRPGVMPVAVEVLRHQLGKLNRDGAPWHVRDGAAEGTDLIVEWRVTDARWYEVFSRAAVTRVHRVFLLLDDATKTVRALDEEYAVDWSGGVPRLSLAGDGLRVGARLDAGLGAPAFTEMLSDGARSYRFTTSELKEPVADCVSDNGWRMEGVLTRGAVTRAAATATAATVGSVSPTSPPPQLPSPYPPSMLGSSPNTMIRPRNPLATAGFVCGLHGLIPFWIGFVLCVLAIVFSAIAMSRSRELGGVGRGLAIAGLVLGLVFILPAACGL